VERPERLPSDPVWISGETLPGGAPRCARVRSRALERGWGPAYGMGWTGTHLNTEPSREMRILGISSPNLDENWDSGPPSALKETLSNATRQERANAFWE